MKKTLALIFLCATSVMAGTVYQPVPTGSPCMIHPINSSRVINASFISNLEMRQSYDLSYPWGPLSLFTPTKTPYYAVYISGPSLYVEIRVKDQVEGVSIVQDTLNKIKDCKK